MKKRLPSLFDVILLLLVIVAVTASSMLAGSEETEAPEDISRMAEEFRNTTERYTDWDEFNTPEQYVQTYVVRFTGEDAMHPELWPEPGTQLLLNYGPLPPLGELKELKVVSDDPENPVLEATVSCYCNYYKTIILTPATVTMRLGRQHAYCLESGQSLGVGTIVKMN